MGDAWMDAWQPVIDAIGQDFSDGAAVDGADPIEASAVRRYLEPLEFDCALHYDRAAARTAGYDDIVLPCSAILSFAVAPMWRPGEVIFTSDARNAAPATRAISGIVAPMEPPTTGYFATDLEVDYITPALVGDRLRRRGARLVACKPRATKVGRGAFLTWESEVINQRDDVVAVLRVSSYRYNPHKIPHPQPGAQ